MCVTILFVSQFTTWQSPSLALFRFVFRRGDANGRSPWLISRTGCDDDGMPGVTIYYGMDTCHGSFHVLHYWRLVVFCFRRFDALYWFREAPVEILKYGMDIGS